jgi:hypothetical protein
VTGADEIKKRTVWEKSACGPSFHRFFLRFFKKRENLI